MANEIDVRTSELIAEESLIYEFKDGKSLKEVVSEMRAEQVSYPDEARELILTAFLKYISDTDLPKLSEFCSLTMLPPSTLKTWPDMVKANEVAKAKAETEIVRLAMNKGMPVPLAIFWLKQHGWKDKPEEERSNVAVQVNLNL